MPSRRDFLRTAAMLTGAAGFAAGVPDAVRRAYAIAPDPGTTWEDAEHIVILMQENRSFDHALGTLQGVRGFNDPRAIRHANGNSIFLQTSVSGGNQFTAFRSDLDASISGPLCAEEAGETIRETNLSEWRRTVCGDLTSCFRPADVSVPQFRSSGTISI